MHVAKAYHNKKVSQYTEAILKCSDKKTCPNLANELNKSRDAIYRSFVNETNSSDTTRCILQNLANETLSGEKTYLIFDDTQINKQYAHEIEGIDVGFDSSSKKPVLGLKMVTAILTDGNIKIPVDTEPFISKWLAQAYYKTKSMIAIGIYTLLETLRKIDLVIADAHFATEETILYFHQKNQNFLMKIPRNRIVDIEYQSVQLQHVLKLKRNSRVTYAKGFFKNIPCYFYAIKIKNGTTVYFVSKDFIDPRTIVEIYRIRWNIEMFHRTAKQKLGLGDCQMRSIEKQRQHALSVMHAYAIADICRQRENFKNVEEVIRHIRIVKSYNLVDSIVPPRENSC